MLDPGQTRPPITPNPPLPTRPAATTTYVHTRLRNTPTCNQRTWIFLASPDAHLISFTLPLATCYYARTDAGTAPTSALCNHLAHATTTAALSPKCPARTISRCSPRRHTKLRLNMPAIGPPFQVSCNVHVRLPNHPHPPVRQP